MVNTIRQFGSNIIVCQLTTRERRWYIVRCHLAPGDRAAIRDVEAAMNEQPRGEDFIVAGGIYLNLERTEGRGQDKEIAAVVATGGLGNILGDFLPLTAHMVQISADVGNNVEREGGQVQNGLHFGVRLPDIPEYGRPGSKAQIRLFHGHGVPARRLPEGAHALLWV